METGEHKKHQRQSSARILARQWAYRIALLVLFGLCTTVIYTGLKPALPYDVGTRLILSGLLVGYLFHLFVQKGRRIDTFEQNIHLLKRAFDFSSAGAALASFLSSERVRTPLEAYEVVVKLKPDDPKAWYNLGEVHADQGNCREAVKAYREAIYLKPDFSVARFALSGVYSKQGHYDDAIATCDAALKLNPEDAYALLGLAISYVGQRKQIKALDILEHLRTLDPAKATQLSDFMTRTEQIEAQRKSELQNLNLAGLLPPDESGKGVQP
jgi:tetratricopeptide (TPR) repeat protein